MGAGVEVVRFSGPVIRPIYEAYTADVDAVYSKFDCLGYPREQRKKSMLRFYATIAIGLDFPSYSRHSQMKVSDGNQNRGYSTIAKHTWFNYLYLKLRLTFAFTNYNQSTAITSCCIHYTN